ncbi:MAG: flagellar hook-length control protein FliK [Henriciella sp.]
MISVLLPETPASSNGPSQAGKTGPAEAPHKEERFSSFLSDDDASDEASLSPDSPKEEDSLAAAQAQKQIETAASADKLIGVKAEAIQAGAADTDAASAELLSTGTKPQSEAEATLAAAVKQGAGKQDTVAGDAAPPSDRRTIQSAEIQAEAQSGLPADKANPLSEDALLTRGQTPITANGETAPPAEAELNAPKQPQGDSVPELEIRASNTTSTTAEASALAKTATLEVGTVTSDSVLSIVQAPSTSSSASVPTGLVPVAPTQVIAAPTELTNVILNALKGGVDPQEQLVVQLDPPELGRVTIDFKFDAQGVQQITVSAENPEALKRLRELHFELTEALKEQGLSEQNMSFREETDQQSQSNWQASERGPAQSTSFAADGPTKPVIAAPLPSSAPAKDRLDLLL